MSAVLTEGQEAYQPLEPGNTSARSDWSGVTLQDREAVVSSTDGVLTRRASYAFNTASAYSPFPEIADSNDGIVINDAADQYPRSLVFDGFAEDDDRLAHGDRPPSKRRRRAPTASSSVRTKQVRTPLVVNLPHGVGLNADFTRGEWLWTVESGSLSTLPASDRRRRGCITKSAFKKTLWLPRATVNMKLVRRYNAEQRAAARVRTSWSSRLQRSDSSVRQPR